ncbi:TRAUB-domain-containing protein [Dentipellis sp. KUC8613]|nr:TRAUB-domain-containing protein [Dentipellis sp. KUC8613]
MATQRLSLAQQIALLDQPAPLDADPEDDLRHASGSPEPEDASAAREHYIDVGPSALRRAQQSISDPKYEGVKTSRSALLEDSDGSVHSDEDAGEPSGSDEDDDDEDIPSSDAEEQSEDEDVPAPPRKNKPRASKPEPEPEQDLATTLRQTRESDVKKGKAVKRQLGLWDSLLDARIRMQKSVVSANRLPPPAQISQFVSAPRCLAAQHALLTEALALSDELSLLREELMRREEVSVDASPRPGKRRRIDDRQDGDGKDGADGDAQQEDLHADEDWTERVHDASEWAVELDHIYHPHLTHTLAKWSAKIAAVAPSALLPSAQTFSRGKGGVQGVGPQIDAMTSGVEGERLRARTRVRRGKGARIRAEAAPEAEAAAEEDPELFDDTDFYQQLLRDVIDAKSGNVGGNEDWKVMQKERKKRKGVDTKASKGRKLRFEVHEKLQHFMVPVPLAGGGWHEEQIDELFASLLGKGFDDSGMAVDEEVAAERAEVDKDVLKGFRVFG